MVAGEEHVRNPETAEVRRPRVLRPFEKPIAGKTLRLCGKLVAQHTRHETRDGVDHCQRRELAAGEDEISQRDLLVDPAQHALVDPLVPAANDDQRPPARQLERLALIEPGALRRKEDDARRRFAPAGRLDRRHERLGLHHHPGAPAIRHVVRDAMSAPGEVADVGHLHAQQALVASLREDALLERGRDHARKQGEDFDRQHGYSSRSNKPSGASTTIRRACGCTSVTKANGTRVPPSSLSKSCGPASSRSSTTPRTVPCGSDTW